MQVLGLRQLQAIHDFETKLWEWSVREETCSAYTGGGPEARDCLPMDSLGNYLYPYLEAAGGSADEKEGESGRTRLHFDGRMRLENGWLLSACADPPFTSLDVSETLAWLGIQQRAGNVEDDSAMADQDDADAAEGDAGGEYSEGGERRAFSRYLRSTLYLDGSSMSGARWYQLASMLYGFAARPWSRSWYVHLYYGGPTGLMTAGLLVLLTYDLLLLLVAVVAVGLYMRFYFGGWRLALLASLQLLLAFPRA